MWREIVAESRHGTGSAILSSKKGRIKSSLISKLQNEKQKRIQENTTEKKHSKKRVSKWIILITFIVCIIFLGIMAGIERYAVRNKCSSVFWNYISDCGIQILCGSFFDVIFSLCAAYLKEKQIRGVVFWRIFLGLMGVLLVFVCFLTYSKIKGAINQQKEIGGIQKKNNVTTENVMQSGENIQDIQRIAVVYKINQDLYMNNKPLEDYYIGQISEENECAVRAEILYNNLEGNIPMGSKSGNYSKLLETADKEYDTYMYQRNRDKDNESENDVLFSDRIDMLQKSLKKREEAHKECEYPENERLLANGYKDMGDEYFGRGMQNDAIITYEQSLGWYMKAIYHAAAMCDYEEMKKSMDLLKKLEKEVEKLNEIDSNRKEKIRTHVEVYDIFVDKLNEDVE